MGFIVLVTTVRPTATEVHFRINTHFFFIVGLAGFLSIFLLIVVCQTLVYENKHIVKVFVTYFVNQCFNFLSFHFAFLLLVRSDNYNYFVQSSYNRLLSLIAKILFRYLQQLPIHRLWFSCAWLVLHHFLSDVRLKHILVLYHFRVKSRAFFLSSFTCFQCCFFFQLSWSCSLNTVTKGRHGTAHECLTCAISLGLLVSWLVSIVLARAALRLN